MGGVGFTKVLDDAPWGRRHTILFTVVSLSFLLDGVLFAVSPLLVQLVAPPEVAGAVFALNLLAEAAGAVLLGWLADKVGRRVMLATSLAIMLAGLLLLATSYRSTLALAAGTSLMTFGVGGEIGAAYAAVAEMTPARVRGRAILLSTNFWNIGSAMIAGLLIAYSEAAGSPAGQVRLLLASALGLAVAVGLARLTMPESPRWLVRRGRAGEAEYWVRRITGYTGPLDLTPPPEQGGASLGEALTRYSFRFTVLAVVTVAQYVTYSLTAYYLPYAPGFSLGAGSVAMVVFYANLGASLGGLLMAPLIDRSRMVSVTASFAGGLATAAALAAAEGAAWEAAFYATLIVNTVFSEWAWASISALQSELFPTGVRASVVGLLTSLTGIAGALLVYATVAASVSAMLASIIALWAAGLAAALAWRLRGLESAGRSVEELVAAKA